MPKFIFQDEKHEFWGKLDEERIGTWGALLCGSYKNIVQDNLILMCFLQLQKNLHGSLKNLHGNFWFRALEIVSIFKPRVNAATLRIAFRSARFLMAVKIAQSIHHPLILRSSQSVPN